MIRGLVRQQEDATRLLGEQLRYEAKEQVSVFFLKSIFFFILFFLQFLTAVTTFFSFIILIETYMFRGISPLLQSALSR